MVGGVIILGMRLRELRAKKLLTVRELARQSGTSEDGLYRIERGQWLPSLTTVRKLSATLNVDPEEVEEFKAAIDKAARRGS